MRVVYGSITLLIVLIISISSFSNTTIGLGEDIDPVKDLVSSNTSRSNDLFIENKGQFREDVKFLSRSGSYAITDDSILFFDTASNKELLFGYKFKDPIHWVPTGGKMVKSYSNYFYGKDPDGWISKARHFTSIEINDIYQGIDLIVYFSSGHLKYDIMVEGGISTDTIEIEILHAEALEIRDDEVVIKNNGKRMVDKDLLVTYLEGTEIMSEFISKGPSSFGFHLENRDLCRPVTIDPIIYSTLIGGYGDDQACNGLAASDGGFVFTGSTKGDHPMKSNPYDSTFNGDFDVIVCKLNKEGSDIVWATYIGDSGWERGYSIAFDENENIYICGTTSSSNFPTTEGAYQEDYAGGAYDQFVLKLKSDGSDLLLSSLFGGSGDDQSKNMVRDNAGDLIFVGSSDSSDYPVSQGSYDTSQNGGFDFTISKMDGTLGSRIFGSFFGGSEDDFGRYVELGPNEEIYVLGKTFSAGLYTPSGSFDSTYSGEEDYFILQMNSSGSQIDRSTYIGGSQKEVYQMWGGDGLRIDQEGALFLTGTTRSSNFPTTPGAFSTTYNGEDPSDPYRGDAFVMKMKPDLSQPIYSTFIGSSNGDSGFGINVDDQGRAYMVGGTGWTGSASGFPITQNAYQSSIHPTNFAEGFFALLSEDGSQLEYSTFIGGTTTDIFNGVEFDQFGSIFLYGRSTSDDFPTTPQAFDRDSQNYDSFVMKWPNMMDPRPPENLKVFNYDIDVVLKWDPPSGMSLSDITNYSVYRGQLPEMMTEIARINDNTFFFDESVPPGMTYYYQVTTHNWLSESDPSNIVSALSGIKPGKVRNFTGIPSNGSVTLTWNHSEERGNPSMDVYEIYRGNDVSNMTKMVELEYNINEYLDSDLTNGIPYFYYIIACNFVGSSPMSNFVSAIPSTIPSRPIDLEAIPGDHEIQLQWVHPANDGGYPIDNYTIWRMEGKSNFSSHATIQYPHSSFLDSDLENGIAYYYKVTAWNSNGESVSSEVTFGIPLGPPSPPMNLSAISRDGAIALMWEPSIDLGGDISCVYEIFRKAPNEDFSMIAKTDSTFHTDDDVENGVTYEYYLIASNSAGSSQRSNKVELAPYGSPTTPTEFDAIAGDGYVKLSWKPPLDDGGSPIIGYSVYRKDMDGNFSGLETDLIWSNEYTDMNVTNGMDYTYYITASTSIYKSKETDEITVTPRGLPANPALLKARAGNGYVQVIWDPVSKDGGSSIIGYKLIRSGDGSVEEQIADLDPDVISFNDTSVENGKEYIYYLIAYNSIGNSPPSPKVLIIPGARPTIPSSVQVIAIGENIQITWVSPENDGGSAISEYVIYRREKGKDPIIVSRINGDTHHYLDENVKESKEYFYSISAVNEYGEGEVSPEISGMVISNDETDVSKIVMGILLGMAVLIIILLLILSLWALSRKKNNEKIPEPVPTPVSEIPSGPLVNTIDEADNNSIEQPPPQNAPNIQQEIPELNSEMNPADTEQEYDEGKIH